MPPAPDSRSRGRESLLRAVLVVGAVAVALGLVELGVRGWRPAPPLANLADPDAPLPAVVYERSVFARHVLPARPHWVKGNHLFVINEKGYRGKNFPWRKPAGERRVVIYGGSAVFDILSDEGRDWPARVQARLAGRGRDDVRVINAGVPGHASFDSLGRLLAEGHRLEPDIVVLYNAWNDIKTFTWEESLLRGLTPYRPKRDWTRFPVNPVDGLLARLSHAWRRLRVPLFTRLRDQDFGREGTSRNEPLVDTFPGTQIEQFRVNVSTFVDLVRNAGARPVLSTQARLPVAGSNEDQRRRIVYRYAGLTHDATVRAFDATDRVIREVAADKGVPVVSAGLLSGRAELFDDAVHTTDAGSDALAALFTPAIHSELDEL